MKLIRQMILGAALMGVGLLGVAPQASALTFTLDCVIGNGSCTTGFNFGTVTITDVAGGVSVTIDTSATAVGSKVLEAALNTTGTVTSSAGATFTFASNAVNMGPYCPPGGCFDVDVPKNGNLGFTPQTFSLFGAGINAASFNTTAGAANLFAGVHIGACSANATCNANGGSLFVGSTGEAHTRVPEPAAALLLGSGLVGLGIWRRKSTK